VTRRSVRRKLTRHPGSSPLHPYFSSLSLANKCHVKPTKNPIRPVNKPSKYYNVPVPFKPDL